VTAATSNDDGDELSALERRREALRRDVAELAKANQAQRMRVLLRSRDNLAIAVALVIALGIGVAVGAIWLPTTRLYLGLCR